MSTRANIIVKDGLSTVYLYRHCDGYPRGLGAELQEFVKGFENNIYWTSSYDIVGRLLTGAVEDIEHTSCLHWDIEYKYIIDVTYGSPKLETYERYSWDTSVDNEEVWTRIS